MYEDSEISEQKKKNNGCLIAIIIVIVIPVLFLCGLRKILIPVNETKFTPERIAELEQEYHIDLHTSEPVRYWHVAMAQDTHDLFSFYTEDYHEFMEQHYFGKILTNSEEENQTFAQYKCEPWPDSKDSMKQRFRFMIKFEQQKEMYYAEIVSYYE